MKRRIVASITGGRRDRRARGSKKSGGSEMFTKKETVPMKTTKQSPRDLSGARSMAEARRRGTRGVRPFALTALTALMAAGCSPQTPNQAQGVGQATDALKQTVLGTAQSFAVLAGSTVTNTGASTVHGNLGVDPGLAITGFPPGLITGGTVHAGDAVALQAENDTTTAYDALAGEAPTLDLTGQDLGGKTLTPGVYHFSSSAELTGVLTLNAEGDPNATFVFQIGSTLTTVSHSSVIVLNGGQDCNIFWQVGSSATLGTTTAFKGNILALTSITLNTGATVSGRTLARNAAVTMDTNSVSILNCAVPADAGVEAGSAPEGGSDGGAMDTGSDAGLGSGLDGARESGSDSGADAGLGIDSDGGLENDSGSTIDGSACADAGATSDDAAIVGNDSPLEIDAGSVCDAQPVDTSEAAVCDGASACPTLSTMN